MKLCSLLGPACQPTYSAHCKAAYRASDEEQRCDDDGANQYLQQDHHRSRDEEQIGGPARQRVLQLRGACTALHEKHGLRPYRKRREVQKCGTHCRPLRARLAAENQPKHNPYTGSHNQWCPTRKRQQSRLCLYHWRLRALGCNTTIVPSFIDFAFGFACTLTFDLRFDFWSLIHVRLPQDLSRLHHRSCQPRNGGRATPPSPAGARANADSTPAPSF